MFEAQGNRSNIENLSHCTAFQNIFRDLQSDCQCPASSGESDGAEEVKNKVELSKDDQTSGR